MEQEKTYVEQYLDSLDDDGKAVIKEFLKISPNIKTALNELIRAERERITLEKQRRKTNV